MEDVENEVRAIKKLTGMEVRAHENIVTVLRHGPLHNSPYYFFDMSLCDFNLESYIQGLWLPTSWETMYPKDFGHVAVERNPRMRYIWTIMFHIARGVEFIHLHNEIHRDLKPRNSSAPLIVLIS